MAISGLDIYSQIKQDIANGILEPLTEDAKNKISEFKEACKTYIQEITNQLNNINNSKSLSQRIQQLRALFYHNTGNIDNKVAIMQATARFQSKMNEFLDRAIPLTNVNYTTGKIRILDENQIFNAYSSTSFMPSSTKIINKLNFSNSLYRNASSYENQFLGKELFDLQDKINIRTTNYAAVYNQTTRRYKNAQEDNYYQYYNNHPEAKPSFYWRDNPTNLNDKTFGSNSVQRSQLGEAWVEYIINTLEEEGNIIKSSPVAIYTYNHYNFILEQGIESIYDNLSNYDSISGALKGDVVYKNNSQIQLAIKSGPSAFSGDVKPYIGIAFSILQAPDQTLISPANLRKELEQYLGKPSVEQGINTIIEALIGESFYGQEYNILIDLI